MVKKKVVKKVKSKCVKKVKKEISKDVAKKVKTAASKKKNELLEKHTTGVPGFDNIISGGFVDYSSILLTGAPGTGKTIFGLQFLIEGAKKGEPGLLMTPEIPINNIKLHARSLGLDLEEYEKKKLLFFCEDGVKGEKFPLKAPCEIIKRYKIKRVVMDSLTFFKYIFRDEMEFRKGLLSFIRDLKNNNIIFMATSERSTSEFDDFRYQPQDFLFDGLIVLSMIRKGASFERTIHVVKLRGQSHDENIYPISIEKGGINVHLKQVPFSLVEKFEK
ncbi:MAG: ATPase domain-containing protein [Nanoarchaeota archaeon]|nr:hypothetical protein [Nanoarchaeota archaeon]MBU1632132.1 hypothetical protein [Nanoarchaeota archaeon]MBU1876197.1 hypothetical protein [Nanoarchaeota archaeon]